jgi:hypothetical protein
MPPLNAPKSDFFRRRRQQLHAENSVGSLAPSQLGRQYDQKNHSQPNGQNLVQGVFHIELRFTYS